MHDEFQTLAQWLAAREPDTPQAALDEPAATAAVAPIPEIATPEERELKDTVAAFRRFRAMLADALDAALEMLLEDISAEVLGRELLLAPVDIHAIAERARDRFALDGPVALRIHPDDAHAFRDDGMQVVPDPHLRRGDAMLQVHGGTIDASLGVRLESVLATACVR